MLRALRQHWGVIGGGLAIAAFVVTSALLVGNKAIGDIVETELRGRSDSFADVLLTEPDAIDSLLTGISREAGTEAKIRQVSNLAGIESFSIFDRNGNEIYKSRSDRYEWMIRDRPGGISTGDSLSQAMLDRKGQWQIVLNDGAEPISVLQPLFRNGERIGFLSIVADVSADRTAYSNTLIKASAIIAFVLLLATGVPFLLFVRRRRILEEADARIEFLANHDNLTRLLNRRRMQEETDRHLQTTRATRERMAYLFIDIDDLAEINDRLGQTNGDELLRGVARRLHAVCSPDDLSARVGPDDFTILRRKILSPDDVHAFARRLTSVVCAPLEIAGETITPRISIGCAMAPLDGRNHTELVKHAEIAHLRHKSSKQDDLVLFEAWMDEEAHRRRQIEAIVREAVENKKFELYYQPLIDGRSHRTIGFEALLRLRDSDGNHISPAEFVPVAEARGYIKRIGTWVIREATRQVAEWPDPIFVSVNLSAVQFADNDLIKIVQTALDEAGVGGERLELEVVESLVLDRSNDVLDQLRRLKALGASLAMDDFGTGYSSLSYLWRFPFNKLKIDQSFMFALARGEKKVEQLVGTIISMAHHMDMKVTTEGVELREQVEMLDRFHCDIIQGYYFGKPMCATDASQRLLSEMRQGHIEEQMPQRPSRQRPASAA